MNNQAVYNKVKRHLLKQGRQSMTADGECAYRGKPYRGHRGVKVPSCAIGCLIPNKRYNPDFEGNAVYPNIRENAEDVAILEAAGLTEAQRMLASDLQDAHDDCLNDRGPEFRREIIRRLVEVAQVYGLKP